MERKAKTVKRLRHILTAEEREGVSQSGLGGIENEWVRNPHADPCKPLQAPPDSGSGCAWHRFKRFVTEAVRLR